MNVNDWPNIKKLYKKKRKRKSLNSQVKEFKEKNTDHEEIIIEKEKSVFERFFKWIFKR